MEINYKALGERIRKIRKIEGMTQEYLAEKLEISTQHMSNIENASKKPSLALLMDLAELLGVTLDELLADSYPREREGDILYTETEMILERCSAKERRIAMEMLEALVSSMIRNRGKDEAGGKRNGECDF